MAEGLAVKYWEEGAGEVFESAGGHLVLKRCLLTYKDRPEEAAAGLPGKFVEKWGGNFADAMMQSSRAAFVLGALCEVSKEAKKKCEGDKKLKKTLKEKAKEEKGVAGFIALADKLK